VRQPPSQAHGAATSRPASRQGAPPDVGGDALERHDGHRAGLLGDARLLDVGDIHDDAALQHLCEARLDGERPELLVGHGC